MNDEIKFDAQLVGQDMSNLEDCFSNFATTLKELNSYIETIINAGSDSAILGDYGSKLLEIWNSNSSTFGDFHANFEAWNSVVGVISVNKSEFEISTEAAYRDNASTLDGIQEARTFVAENGRGGDVSGLSAEAQAVMGAASLEAGTDEYISVYTTDENGWKTETRKGSDGDIAYIKTFDDNGIERKSQYFSDTETWVYENDEQGNRISVTYYDLETNEELRKTRYLEDGLVETTVYTDEGYTVTLKNDGDIISEESYTSDHELIESSESSETSIENDAGAADSVADGENNQLDDTSSSSKRIVVEDDSFYATTTYAQFQNGGGIDSPVYLNDDMTIYYQNGKIIYPDNHYETVTLSNVNDFEEAWKNVNGLAYKSDVPLIVPEGYTLKSNGDFQSSYAYNFAYVGSSAPVYLNDDMTIYYENGQVFYPDGSYESVDIPKNIYDMEELWKDVNNFVYEDECQRDMTDFEYAIYR